MSLKEWQKLLFGIGMVAGVNQNSSATEQQGIVWLKNSNTSNISSELQAIYEKEVTLGLYSQTNNNINIDELLNDEQSTEALVRAIILLKIQQKPTDQIINKVLSYQNLDGGFGHLADWQSNPLDTAWVLLALKQVNSSDTTKISKALEYLASQQRTTGAFQVVSLDEYYVTAYALTALTAYLKTYPQYNTVALKTVNYLESKQLSAGSWAENSEQLFLDALLNEALHPYRGIDSPARSAFKTKVLEKQAQDGSWNEDTYTTSIILRSLKIQSTPVVNPVTSAISFTVVDAETKANISGATISGSVESASSLNLQSKDDGSVLFTDVKAGDYGFTVEKEGFGSLTFQVTLRQGESLNLGQIELTRRANVTNALVQGRVIDKITGQSVVGAEIKLVSGTNTLTTTTNAEGRYQITLAQPAAFTLSVAANGYVGVSGSGTATAGSTFDFSPQLTSEQAYIGNVTGKVTDGSGTALAGVSILKNGMAVGQTDASGQFVLDKTTAGSFTLTFEKVNYQGPNININLPAGQTANIGTVQLFAQDSSNPTQPEPTLAKGIFEIDVINSTNNKFIQNPLITAEKLDSNNQVIQSHTFTTTSTLTAELSTGRWRITAIHPDYQSAVSVVKILDANQTQKVEIKLVLLPYQIKGKVLDSLTNKPIYNAIVNVYRQDDGQILQTIRTDIDGLFKTNNISNDLVTIEVQSTVYLRTSRNFSKQYGSSQLVDLGEFRLRPLSAEISLPDLKVVAINTNDIVTDQQSLQTRGNLKATIKNVGNKVFTKTQEVEVIAFADTNNNRILDENEIILGRSSLDNGLDVQENIELSINLYGNSLFRDAPIAVWVDSKKQVAELNEDNNVALSYENKIFNQTVVNSANKELNTTWSVNNLSILTQPLIINVANSNSNQLAESKILFIDNNGSLNLVNGTDGKLEWSLNLNLSAATGQTSEKLNFSKRNGLIYVSDVKNKKILRVKVSGQIDGEIYLGDYKLESIPFILNDYNRDGVDDIITPIGVYDEKKKVWIYFNYNGLNIIDSDIHAFYSKKYNDNLYLVSNIIFDSTGNILKKSNGNPIYSANSQSNSIFAVVNLTGDQDPEIIKRTCNGNAGYSQIEIYSLEQEKIILTLAGGDCRFKEDFVVADFDGDGKPDFYVDGRVYRNDGSILFSLNRNQFESLNGSAFNFDNDSNFDLVVNRSGKLVVYDGKTGQERYFLNLPISSNSPKPLIADVNADGIADIVVGLNGASCTDNLPFSSASLPSADVKVVIRWSGGPDLDINTQFNNIKHGWAFNSSSGSYVRWLGDNTNGGPEYVFLSSSEAKAKGLLDQDNNLVVDLGAAWYSGRNTDNWARYEVSTTRGQCATGIFNNLDQSVGIREPEVTVKVPTSSSDKIKKFDYKTKQELINDGSNFPGLHVVLGNEKDWYSTNSFWVGNNFYPEFYDQTLNNKIDFVYPKILNGNIGLSVQSSDPTASYIRVNDQGGLNKVDFTVRIGNAGGKRVAKDLPVSFYRVTAQQAANGEKGTLLATVLTTKVLNGGEYEDVTYSYVGNLSDFGEIVIVANDAAQSNAIKIQEYTEANNTARLSVTGGYEALGLTANLDKAAYQANENMQITANVNNLGSFGSNATVRHSIYDSSNNLIATLPSYDISLSAANQINDSHSQTLPWSLVGIYSGQYRVQTDLIKQGTVIATANNSLTIQSSAAAEGLTDTRIRTDKQQYPVNGLVTLEMQLQNTSSNDLGGATTVATEVFDNNGQIIFSQTTNYPQLAANALKQEQYPLQLSNAKPGNYTVRATTTSGQQSYTRQTSFNVLSSTQTGLGLIGALSATPNEVPVGNTVLLNLQVQNTGSEVWSNLPLNIRLFKNDDVDAIATLSTTANQLAQAQSYQHSLSWKTLGQNGDRITAALTYITGSGQEKPLAQASFKLVQVPVEVELPNYGLINNQLLVYYNCHAGWHKSVTNWGFGKFKYACFSERENTLKRYLNEIKLETGLNYKITYDPIEFKKLMRSGRYNNYWVLGAVEKFQISTNDELRELSFNGESVLFDKGLLNWTNYELLDLVDIRYRGHLMLSKGEMRVHEPVFSTNLPVLTPTDDSVLAWDLGSNAKITADYDGAYCKGFDKDWIKNVEANVNSKFYICNTQVKYPAIVTADYGDSKPLALSFDLLRSLITDGSASTVKQQAWKNLLKQSLSYQQVDATKRLSYAPKEPVYLSVKLNSNQDTQVTIVVQLPHDAQWLGSEIVKNNQVKLTVPLSGITTQNITLPIVLPTNSGTHAIKVNVYNGTDISTTALNSKEYRFLVRGVNERIALLDQQIGKWRTEIVNWGHIAKIKALLATAKLKTSQRSYDHAIAGYAEAGGVMDHLNGVDTRAARKELDELIRTLQIQWYQSNQ